MNLPLFQIMVRRDQQTTTPVIAPAHELPILKYLYGNENVTQGKEVGDYPCDLTHEYERLTRKYGGDKVLKIYGEEQSGQLAARLQAINQPAESKSSK